MMHIWRRKTYTSSYYDARREERKASFSSYYDAHKEQRKVSARFYYDVVSYQDLTHKRERVVAFEQFLGLPG